MRHIKIKPGVPGFLIGSRFVSPADGPIEIDDARARDLIAYGLAIPCAAVETPRDTAEPIAQANPVERAEKPPTSPERATLRR